MALQVHLTGRYLCTRPDHESHAPDRHRYNLGYSSVRHLLAIVSCPPSDDAHPVISKSNLHPPGWKMASYTLSLMYRGPGLYASSLYLQSSSTVRGSAVFLFSFRFMMSWCRECDDGVLVDHDSLHFLPRENRQRPLRTATGSSICLHLCQEQPSWCPLWIWQVMQFFSCSTLLISHLKTSRCLYR